MPKVIIASAGSCHQFTGGKTEFDVEATTFRQLLRELERNYPGLGSQVEEGGYHLTIKRWLLAHEGADA